MKNTTKKTSAKQLIKAISRVQIDAFYKKEGMAFKTPEQKENVTSLLIRFIDHIND